MAGKGRKHILILDPEKDTAALFSRALENYRGGFRCHWANDCPQARSLLCEIVFTFVLADVSILQRDRFFLLDSIKGLPSPAIVFATAYINENKAIRTAMAKGAAGYLIKPVMVCTLRKLIDDFSGR